MHICPVCTSAAISTLAASWYWRAWISAQCDRIRVRMGKGGNRA